MDWQAWPDRDPVEYGDVDLVGTDEMIVGILGVEIYSFTFSHRVMCGEQAARQSGAGRKK